MDLFIMIFTTTFRRKKTKCSGERPACFYCRRSNRPCVYEPYSATIADSLGGSPGANANNVRTPEEGEIMLNLTN